MANTIIIKNGAGAPPAGALQTAELGFDTTNKKLYVGHTDGDVEVNVDGVTVDLEETTSGTVLLTNADTLGGVPAECYAKAVKLTPRNLLDNSDFRNPVNQRGQTSYTGQGYTIDRWQKYAGALNLVDGGMACDDSVFQMLELSKISTDKVYTMCAGLKDGTVWLGSGNLSNGAGKWDSEGIAWAMVDTSTNLLHVRLESKTGIFSWAALYEGEYTAETLPEYQPKGYGVELVECQRYYQIHPMLIMPDSGYTVPITIPMRINPSVVIQVMDGTGTPSSMVMDSNTVIIWVENSQAGISVELSADL